MKDLEKKLIAILKKHEKRATNYGFYHLHNTSYESVATEVLALFDSEKRYAKGFTAGQRSIRQKNKSGCCCTFSDDDTEIIKLCGAHEAYYLSIPNEKGNKNE